ncbi:MAG: hypothetical protein KZQ93_04995 [Candidatus Thiodiazotropha sp. (ex Monitilora ramsayi)]|nr:hypothetical protein [Candidatus Thiodiazotropha sp. (ex Monitilora ramsayi)]
MNRVLSNVGIINNRLFYLLVVILLSINSTLIYSVEQPASEPLLDPGEVINSGTQEIETGEYIDIRTGNVYLSVADIKVPGNGGMDIEVRRAYNKNPLTNYLAPHSIGNWEVELPRIFGNAGLSDYCANPRSRVYVSYKTLDLFGYATAYTSQEWAFDYPFPHELYAKDWNYGNPYIEFSERIYPSDPRWGEIGWIPIETRYTPRAEYVTRPYYGLSLSVPGEGTKQLLEPVSNTVFSSAKYVTNDNWKVNCIAKDGVNNAGFQVISPDGTKYTFDKSFTYQTTSRESWRINDFRLPIKSADNLHKPVHYYPSKKEDKYGNYLSYVYVRDSLNTLHIKTITSSEGEIVTFNYENTPSGSYLLDNIEVNGNVWDYVFSGNYLDKVILPDSTAWEYTYQGNHLEDNKYQISTIKNPLGGEITYQFTKMRADFFGGRENSEQIYVLSSKTISGSNVKTGKISYFYDKDSYGNNRTKIASYAGLREYVYHNPNDWKMGALLSTKTSDTDQDLSLINSYTEIDSTRLKEIESTSYTWTSILQVGDSYSRFINASNNYKRALSSKTVNRDGTDYVTTYLNYDDFGSPSRVEETSGGKSRYTEYTYYNNTSNWILGILDDETITGIGTINRTLDPVNGNVLSKSTFGTVEGFTYHDTGDLHEYTDQNGVKTQYEEYKRGKPRTINKSINKKGTHTVTQVITDNGEIESVTIAGKTTSYEYSGTGKITKITKPKISTDPIIIDYLMLPTGYTQTIDRGTYNKTITYDGFGRAVSVDEEGIVTQSEYDKSGRLSKKFLPNSSEAEEYIYDALDRIFKAYPPTSHIDHTLYKYLVDNKTEITDTNGKVKTLSYQSYGDPNEQHLITIDAEEGVSLSIERDLLGKIKSVTQGTFKREYHYDLRQMLDYTINPESGMTDYDFDDAGNMVSKHQLNYPFIWYVYDGMNRLDFINHPAGTDDIDYEYYEDGLLKTVAKGSTEWFYDYDDNSNLELEQFDTDINDPNNTFYFFHRTYNNNDHLVDITYPSGLVVNYNPNDLGQPETVTPYISDVDYFPNGQVDKIRFANGVITDYTQDSTQRLKDINVNSPHMLLLASNTYLYDYQNNVKNIFDNRNSLNNYSFLYDGVERLSHVNGSQVLTYEPNGNIKTKNIGGRNLTYQYDSTTNLLTDVTDSGQGFYSVSHDPKGNMTSNGTDNFTYNDINQLITVPSKGIQYNYDGNGNRYDIQSTEHVHSVYSTNGHLLHENNLNTGKITEYFYLGDQLIAKNQECVESDLDGDGLIDCIEDRYGLNLNDSTDAVLDLDGDGLSNIQEISLGLNPKNSDTDVDNIPDEYEVRYGLDAKVDDSDLDIDNDGLSNYEEYIHNTNPNLADTDGDGMSDGEEIAAGSNPNFNVAVMVAINYLILN